MKFISDFLSLIYPVVCQACNNSLFKHEKVVCHRCLYRLPRTRFAGEPKSPVASVFWGRVPLQSVAVAFYYNKGNAVQELIHKFKYRGNREIGFFLGEALGEEILKCRPEDNIDLIIPVPLHPKKQRKRGFNQSQIIAEGIAKKINVTVNTNVLFRKTFSSTQTRKSKYDRWQNVAEIFDLKDPSIIENKHILIVDDVITTGATIEACCHVLLKVEGVRVSVAAVAYTRV
jgi:ComF family protein